MTSPERTQLQEILAQVPPDEWDSVEGAYQFARQRHAGIVRSSGTPFLCHLLATAKDIAAWTHDPILTTSALLHDVLDQENTIQPAQLSEVRASAGNTMKMLLKGFIRSAGSILITCTCYARAFTTRLAKPSKPRLSFIATHAAETAWLPRAELATLCGADHFDLDQTLGELLELETLEQRLTGAAVEYRIRLPLFTGWILNNFSLPHLISKRQKS